VHFCDFWGPKKILELENFLLRMTHSRVILCGESIARIPEALKCFLDPDSGDRISVLIFFFARNEPYGGPSIHLMWGIDCTHFLSMKNYLDPDSGNGVGVLTRKS
jgi:hypothetical protein